jgi:hypothetical protein
MDAYLLIVLILAPRGGEWNGTSTPTIPDTLYVVSRDNLRESASLDVSNFDEARVEEDDIRRVVRCVFGGTFPFDG